MAWSLGTSDRVRFRFQSTEKRGNGARLRPDSLWAATVADLVRTALMALAVQVNPPVPLRGYVLYLDDLQNLMRTIPPEGQQPSARIAYRNGSRTTAATLDEATCSDATEIALSLGGPHLALHPQSHKGSVTWPDGSGTQAMELLKSLDGCRASRWRLALAPDRLTLIAKTRREAHQDRRNALGVASFVLTAFGVVVGLVQLGWLG